MQAGCSSTSARCTLGVPRASQAPRVAPSRRRSTRCGCGPSAAARRPPASARTAWARGRARSHTSAWACTSPCGCPSSRGSPAPSAARRLQSWRAATWARPCTSSMSSATSGRSQYATSTWPTCCSRSSAHPTQRPRLQRPGSSQRCGTQGARASTGSAWARCSTPGTSSPRTSASPASSSTSRAPAPPWRRWRTSAMPRPTSWLSPKTVGVSSASRSPTRRSSSFWRSCRWGSRPRRWR
mmetsp:Transcript_102423/g.305907  ORF Transcript_102423/g.305907 Transcript_102423/m.305907 type:complete len:240 (-) Transcript_102423:222-941(-)